LEGKRAKHDTLGCEVEGTKFPGVFKTLMVLLTGSSSLATELDSIMGKLVGFKAEVSLALPEPGLAPFTEGFLVA